MPRVQSKRKENANLESVRKSFQNVVERVQLYSDLNARSMQKGRSVLARNLSYSLRKPRKKAKGWLKLSFHCWFTPTIVKAYSDQKVSVIAAICKKDGTGIFHPLEAVCMGPIYQNKVSQDPCQGLLHLAYETDRTELCLLIILESQDFSQSEGDVHPTQCKPREPDDALPFGICQSASNISWGTCPITVTDPEKVTLCQGSLRLAEHQNLDGKFPALTLKQTSEITAVCSLSSSLTGTACKIDSSLHVPQEERPVLFRFIFDEDRRYYSQASKSPQCPFCNMLCNSLQGLRQHLEASHDSFNYWFPEEHPDVVPAVNVRCKTQKEFDSRDFFGKTPAHPELLSENYTFFCPKKWRGPRQKQYSWGFKARQHLPLYITNVPMRLPAGSKAAVHLQRSIVKPKPRQKKKERKAPVGPPIEEIAKRPFFHARTHMPMTHQEVMMILRDPKSLPDSDDEEDTEEGLAKYKDKQKRIMRNKTDLGRQELEFMLNWNVFLKENPVHADLQVPERCRQFCVYSAEAIACNAPLRKCLVDHLITLWDYALISPQDLDSCIQIVNNARPQPPANQDTGVIVLD